MVDYVLKNLKNHRVNLGKRAGKMLVLNPKESKVISQQTVNNFNDVLENYMKSHVSLEKKETTKKRVSDNDGVSGHTDQPGKKTTKKSPGRPKKSTTVTTDGDNS